MNNTFTLKEKISKRFYAGSLYLPKKFSRFIELKSRKTYSGNYNVLFVLGHMRSGSTLVSHILQNNQNIACLGETHITYRNDFSFRKLRIELAGYLNDRTEWIADKILLTDHIKCSLNTLNKYVDKIIVVYREPLGSINSMLDYSHTLGKNRQTKEELQFYYIETLSALIPILRNIKPESVCSINYDNFVSNPQEYLDSMSSFLSLRTPLTEKYELHDKTGVNGTGDASDNIKAGKIIRPNVNEKKRYVAVSKEAHLAYKRFDSFLKKNFFDYDCT